MVPPAPGAAGDPASPDGHAARDGVSVWPWLGAALIVVAVATALVPAVRAQAELSVTRRAPEFVELAAVTLDDQGDVGTTCAPGPGDGPGGTQVVFRLVSHHDDPVELGYRVRVSTPTAAFGRTIRRSVRLAPGATKTRVVDVALPRSVTSSIEVRLPSTGQYLLLRCRVAG